MWCTSSTPMLPWFLSPICRRRSEPDSARRVTGKHTGKQPFELSIVRTCYSLYGMASQAKEKAAQLTRLDTLNRLGYRSLFSTQRRVYSLKSDWLTYCKTPQV